MEALIKHLKPDKTGEFSETFGGSTRRRKQADCLTNLQTTRSEGSKMPQSIWTTQVQSSSLTSFGLYVHGIAEISSLSVVDAASAVVPAFF